MRDKFLELKDDDEKEFLEEDDFLEKDFKDEKNLHMVFTKLLVLTSIHHHYMLL